jgi:hypothetical protein
MSALSWKLELLLDESTRLPKLLQPVPFEQVAEDVAAGMTVLCCHRSCSSIKGTSFSRVAYCVQIERDLFDLFFNSESGYRAAYFRSPWEGLGANVAFLKAVSPKLVGSHLSNSCGLSPEFIRESLATPSAKVWLAEHGKEVERDCMVCQGEWSTGSAGDLSRPEIRNGRWELARNVKASWGSKAPYLTKLRILGAFLDEHFNELVPFDKRFRAREIHDLGWS